MIVVTSSSKFIDIDALACAIAYAELLIQEGVPARAVLNGTLNSSITETMRGWGLDFDMTPPEIMHGAVIVDLSDPEHLANFVTPDQVTEVFDHHVGFELYWRKRLNEAAHIEFVGACATLIWEEIVRRGRGKQMSELAARLLATAIISNTLNFRAQLTTQRDRAAYAQVATRANLPASWVGAYYEEQEQSILSTVANALRNDTKIQKVPNLGLTLVIGQLELWDSPKLLTVLENQIVEVMHSYGNSQWFFSSPCIREGKNYLICPSPAVRNLLTRAIGAEFVEDKGTTPQLWLRKEILRELYTMKEDEWQRL